MSDVPNNRDDVPTAEPAPPAPERVGTHRPLWFWIVSAAAAIVVLFVVAVPVTLTASPHQCASCHEMRPYYDSWQASSHREAAKNCLDCHAKPGVLGVLVFEAGFYRMLAGHFAGTPVLTTAANAPAVASCTRSGCHSLNRETSTSGDVKINHRLHVTQAKIPCTRCHPGAVHTGVNGRVKLPPMKLCKGCHADKMQQCSYCHTQEHLTAPAGVH